jgi:hypothetical protein
MNDGPIEIVDAEPEVFSLPLEELRRLLVVATDFHHSAERELEKAKTLTEAEAEANPYYALCKNEGERARYLASALVISMDYPVAVEAEAEARMECDIYRTEIQIREDARRDRQMAQRDRELDILAGNLALDERRQAHIEKQRDMMGEQMAALRATVEAVHADHADHADDLPFSVKVGRA